MAQEITQGNTLGLNYTVFARSGTVSSTETRSKTEVTGNISGGGGSSHNGTGYTAPVSGSVTSKTTDYQDIFLTEDDGTEHLIQTENFLVPCREGQQVTFLFATTGRGENGSYFSAYNHNSRQSYDHYKALRSEMFPWLTTFVLLCVVCIPMFIAGFTGPDGGIGGALLSLLVGVVCVAITMGVVGNILSAIRASQVKADSRLRQYRSQLANAPAPSSNTVNPTTV